MPAAPTNLLATRVGPCSKEKKSVITVSELAIYTKIYDSTISGYFNVSMNITNGWIIKGTMQKCQDMRNLETCDYFKSFSVVKNGCSEDASPDEQDLYTMFFHHTTPRMSCPIEAGSYRVQGYPFFNEDNYLTVSESKISTSLFGYTYKLEGTSKDVRYLFCVEAYLQLLYVREHNWGNDVQPPEYTPAPGAPPADDIDADADDDDADNQPFY
ncbi:uncharacterized protein LOC114362009 [Ostrinia furnacalis]|uniref:uncharacterized protein LOC114362009 n=1 Tax=Ostrinia furnacalis TaxID=93504 RepID=UPI00103A4AFF|nr:uncharacterized protein LOC114362009 [Ostrinia furnacalis]